MKQEKGKNEVSILPPSMNDVSKQLDLFGSFLSNNESEVSNTIAIWDSIPKYFFTTKMIEELRTEDGLATPYTWTYTYEDTNEKIVTREVTIDPALIQQDDGSYKAFFPTGSEELVEEVLRKILSEQNHGMHDAHNHDTWVLFTLRQIYNELKTLNKTKSLTQIKHYLAVMSKCNLTVKDNGVNIYDGAILPELFGVAREQYQTTDAKKKWMAKLPLFVGLSISKLDIRQFNYVRWGRLKIQLGRWLLKKLVNKYKQAHPDLPYHFTYNETAGSSGLLRGSETEGRKRMLAVLEEWVVNGIIKNNYKIDVKQEGKKILDVTYTVYAAQAFTTEQKASNKRDLIIQEKAKQSQLKLINEKW